MHGVCVFGGGVKDGEKASKVLQLSYRKTVLLYGFKPAACLVCLSVFKLL